MLKIAVITVSDRASRGEYKDKSGPKIKEILLQGPIEIEVKSTIVPDEKEDIQNAILNNLGKDFILTTGGTGISPRDITPEITREICDKELPGVSEMLRAESYKETKNAVLSRGFSGIRDKTIIINFPGSVKAVTLCANLIYPILPHAQKMLHGGGH
jgi:molybdopterin adenylyltransferase